MKITKAVCWLKSLDIKQEFFFLNPPSIEEIKKEFVIEGEDETKDKMVSAFITMMKEVDVWNSGIPMNEGCRACFQSHVGDNHLGYVEYSCVEVKENHRLPM